ncbi:LOW QUALITY PROTEIN: uncharacterized protein [Mycetomoellerius zeteki]|uniref:LOW QUALITY PROTEIN: uncharacterized protein n=1 Tax=Mycetomoellerius zeteki TaxID=64791 RepID=UPI00084E4F8E|nr:PREDICTED: LOW QUALITY PROTEIN: uncharacterized protein LOC108727603 [Trachymyrmex zeteki]
MIVTRFGRRSTTPEGSRDSRGRLVLRKTWRSVGYHAMPAGIGRVWWAKRDQYWEAFDMERRRPVCSPRGTRTGINGCYWHDLDCDLNLDNALERDTKARRRRIGNDGNFRTGKFVATCNSL